MLLPLTVWTSCCTIARPTGTMLVVAVIMICSTVQPGITKADVNKTAAVAATDVTSGTAVADQYTSTYAHTMLDITELC